MDMFRHVMHVLMIGKKVGKSTMQGGGGEIDLKEMQ